MLMFAGLAYTSANIVMGVLWCLGGSGVQTRARWGGLTFCLQLPLRFMNMKKGLLVRLYLLAKGECYSLSLTLSHVKNLHGT